MLYPVEPGLSRNYPNGLSSNPVLSEIDIKWLKKIYPTEPTTFKKYYFCTDDEGCVETELESGYETMAECEQKCKRKGKGKKWIVIAIVGIIILLLIIYFLSKKRSKI